MKRIIIITAILFCFNYSFGAHFATPNELLQLNDIRRTENIITITNNSTVKDITVYIYKDRKCIGSIYIPSGATRSFGIGNNYHYSYSYSVGDSDYITSFYSDNITIY